MRYYENLSVKEISKKLNIPPQKVSDYLKYAKILLLEKFNKLEK
jgi:DNA-directed RNA polymerase specialized sigma24 family protein